MVAGKVFWKLNASKIVHYCKFNALGFECAEAPAQRSFKEKVS